LTEAFTTNRDFFRAQHHIVPAAYFKNVTRNPGDYHNKVVIGRLLSIVSPDNGGSFYGRTAMVNVGTGMGAAKKPKVTMPTGTASIMLTFGDYYDLPNCFCIFIQKKTTFQHMFGDDITKSEIVRVGDIFAIKDPQPSRETLGTSIVILRDPFIISSVATQNWPTQEIASSSDANWQVFFDETGKTVSAHGVSLVNNTERNHCNGFTCDRQALCKGCFGRTNTSKPIVLMASIFVNDTPGFSYATFRRFTSLRFTSLFFKDLQSLSSKDTNCFTSMYNPNQESVENMVQYVNAHGGWRVCGWHRRGVVQDKATGEDILSSATVGHITLLEPTQMEILRDPAYVAMMIATPCNNDVPPVEEQVLQVAHVPPPPPPPPPHVGGAGSGNGGEPATSRTQRRHRNASAAVDALA
jgi:hypothetical protein